MISKKPFIALERLKVSPQPERPPDIPADYDFLMMNVNGNQLEFWGKVVETIGPQGAKKLTVEGFIPESE